MPRFESARPRRAALLALTSFIVWAFSSIVLADPALTPSPGLFPIGAFPGPPAEANTLSAYQKIKDANFTLVCPSYRYDQQANLAMLDHCDQVGLEAVVNVKLMPPTAQQSLPDDVPAQVDGIVSTYGSHRALFGYMLKDEPGSSQFDQIGKLIAEFRRRDDSHATCVNLFPIHATADQLETSSYQRYLDDYLSRVRPDFLCYDHYTFLSNGQDRPDYFHNLEVARQAARRFGTPCWIVILAGWHEHFREPTPAQMRWQAYSALAYGVKGIFYFTFWPVNDQYRAVVDFSGNPGPLYDPIRHMNAEILQLGRTLLNLESTGVYHTGTSLPEGVRRLRLDMPVNVPQNLPLVVGFFQSGDGDRYAMIVNRDYQREITTPIRFSPGTTAVSRIDERTGSTQPLPLTKGESRITLPAGSGALLQIRSPVRWQDARKEPPTQQPAPK